MAPMAPIDTTATTATPVVKPATGPSLALSSATIGMMLADARLPVGGHVHSGGLEPALAGGMPPSQVPGYMRGRARTVTLVEAGTAVVARHVALNAERGRVQIGRAHV